MINKGSTIMLLFAGPAKNKWNISYDYYESLYQHILLPLMHKLNIYISIGCAPEEVNDWQIELINKLPSEVKARIYVLEPVDYNEDNCFTPDRCKHRDRLLYIRNHSKLYHTYNKALDYMTINNLEIDYIMKIRFDFIYNPVDFFDINWLYNIPDNTVLVPSTEFHMGDRWKERTSSFWPIGMCDQMVVGKKDIMNLYFNIYKYKGPLNANLPPPHLHAIECMLADYFIYHGINCLTFDLQISQPGGGCKFVIGNWGWLPKRDNLLR